MIIHLKNSVADSDIAKFAEDLKAFHIKKPDYHVLVTPSAMQEVPAQYKSLVEESFVFPNDMQLSSADYFSATREININETKIGGDTNNTMVIAGPCSVESEEQITQSAELMKELGIGTLRAGCYKPRTSPYTFQGMGIGRGDKVAIFKHKGRKNHRKGVGHRQNFTALRIKDIKA